MIFKVEKRRRRKNGVLVLSRVYYLRYRFGDMPTDKWKSLGVTDKQVAQKRADEFRREWEQEADGLIVPKTIRESAKRCLNEHLLDYLGDMSQRGKGGRREKNIRQVRTRVSRVFGDLGWKLARDITADGFTLWRNKQSNLSPKTLNHYLDAISSFLNWCVRMGRIQINPLSTVTRVDVRGRLTRIRRSLNDDELNRLLNASPAYRSIVYFAAARTGLRHGELESLVWGDLSLDSDMDSFTVRASQTKNKKTVTLPMYSELAKALRELRPTDLDHSAKVFARGVPRARTLRKDLRSAGVDYVDTRGRFADFHSLRYTWCTFLQRNGVPQAIAMRLMRHSSIELTSKLYTDESLLPIKESVDRLPNLFSEKCTQILIQNPDLESLSESIPDADTEAKKKVQVTGADKVKRFLSQLVASNKLVEVAGVEPASLEPSRKASTCLFSFLISPI